MSDDDPTGWFHPERRTPAGGSGGDGARPGDDSAADDAAPDPDGLDSLFGQDDENDGIDDPAPAGTPGAAPSDAAARAAAGDVPTQAWSAVPDEDPLDWLNPDGSAPAGDAATEVYRPGATPPGPPAPPVSAAAPTEVFGAAAAAPIAGASAAAPIAGAAATQRFDGLDGLPPAQDYDAVPADGDGTGPNKGLIALIIVAAVLLIGLVIVLIVALGGGGPTPAASPTDSDTPSTSATPSRSTTPAASPSASATPTPTPTQTVPAPTPTRTTAPPPAPAPSIEPGSFEPTSAPMCGLTDASTTFGLKWSTANATKVVITGQGYSQQVAQSGNQDGVLFSCNSGPQSYTLTATNADGRSVQQSIQVSPSDDE